MDQNEIFTLAGVFFSGIIMGLVGYLRKKPEQAHAQDTVVAGVGFELGNRLQIDQVIAELKRIADSLTILADRKQATTEAKLDRILQDLAEAEERDQRRPRQRKPRVARP